MVSTSEGLIYYSAVYLTVLVFLTEASAIATNYEKSSPSVTPNKTHEPHDLPHRTKLTPRNRSTPAINASPNQNHERFPLAAVTKLRSTRIDAAKPDNELLLVSNSGGENEVKDKGGGSSNGSSDDDDQKTLSEQVADGKYGLIQNEIFASRPQRPGVLSYDVNPEVPKDNINNLGGLESDDIWLAENHLLVLAGSSLGAMQSQWTPIDNYVAPRRPVKLPANPKIPPPFPVQLFDNGPVEYIGSGARPNPTQSFGFYNPLLMQYPTFNNKSHGSLPSLYDSKSSYGQTYGSPMRSPSFKPSFPINTNLPPPSPVLVKPPPGAEFIPPYLGASQNQSEAIDEDDPSLYYPPPYDFFYPRDNTSRVPAGPLVPGIVLPPPPDFFSSFNNNKTFRVKDHKPVTMEKPFKQTVYKIGKQLQHPEPDFNSVVPVTTTTTVTPPAQPQDAPGIQPNSFFNYNDIVNDVTYPITDDQIPYSGLKSPQVMMRDPNQDWIPIPAPRPYYITGPKKPGKNTVLVMMDTPPQGYNYQLPETPLKVLKKRPTVKFLQYLDSPQTFPSTTPLVSQIVSTAEPPSSTVHSTTPVTPPYDQPTIKATYYFYEEPKFIDIGKTKVVSTTANPIVASTPTPIPTSAPVVTPSSPILVEKKRKPTPMIPIYYLAELNNLVDDLLKPNLRSNLPSGGQFYSTTSRPNYDRPTSKPILEYSYVASDYNAPDPSPQPPHSHSPTSTPSPPSAPAPLYDAAPHYHVDYSTFFRPAPQPYPIYNPPVQSTAAPILLLNNFNHYQPKVPVAAPQYYNQPWLPQSYNPLPYPTESPFYAFFTKEDEDLIDENTKKYFTLFGQKLKHEIESTSPLPAQAIPAATSSNRWNTKYYPSHSTPGSYASLSSTISPAYQKPTPTSSYHPSSSTKKPSLQDDTRVNYVTPLPPVNPDAEYLPSKISQHIRPIVVGDLPPDVHERLRNIMHSNSNYNPHHHKNQLSSAKGSNNFHYNIINNHHRQPPSHFDYNYYNSNIGDSSTPVSLHSDIRVNYKRPQKLIKNPDAEYISSAEQITGEQTASKETDYDSREGQEQKQRTSKPVSLADDILVNYRGRYNEDPDAEYVASNGGSQRSGNRGSSSNNNVVSYRYPGVDHGHFYFLTPQETHLSQIEDEMYNTHSDAEKPSSYFKRQKHATSTTSNPARAA